MYTHEQLLQDQVTESLNDSLADTALPSISQAHVPDIVAVSQSDDLELRSKVWKVLHYLSMGYSYPYHLECVPF